MKTNNKLLLGLIVALFLMVTFVVGAAKYYGATAPNGRKQNSEQGTDELSFQQETSSKVSILYFPMALLQPPLQLR